MQIGLFQPDSAWDKPGYILADNWFSENSACRGQNAALWQGLGLLKWKQQQTSHKISVPFKMFLIVPFGLFHMCFRLTLASSVNYIFDIIILRKI